MIKAELSYNPYLLETIVKFNGQKPRINSLVEKFQDGTLEKWVRRIPDIFYDEMNGYDFELEFSGTKRDFLEVVNAFRRKGVSEEMVPIFHKNELGNRYEKSRLIDALISWLEENNNRNFDFCSFQKEYGDFFSSSYVYIIFQGAQMCKSPVDENDIAVEYVESIDELKDTDLSNTPILVCVSKDNINLFQNNLRYFMGRKDVEHVQLFFLIHPSLDAGKVERIIKDMGIAEPNIVAGAFSESVRKYIEMYPVSEYIHLAVTLLRNITNELSERLQAESEKCAIKNKEIHARIDKYEDTISRLKDVHQKFVNRDNIEIPEEWNSIGQNLMKDVNNWRKRRTKITDNDEAGLAANEFEVDVNRYFTQFLEKIVVAANTTKQNIATIYETWYKNAEFDTGFQANTSEYNNRSFSTEISVAEKLKSMFEEKYVQPKEDILGFLFKASPDTPKEPVLQRTYYYQNWREYVAEVVETKEKEIIRNHFECVQKYEQEISQAYIEHLANLIEEQTKLKKREAEKLSDEERLLQNDLDWLEKVQDKLRVIEKE